MQLGVRMVGRNLKRTTTATGLGIVCALALTSCSFFDPRGSLDPRDGFGSDVYLLPALELPVDVTDTVCPSRWGCEKAAESERVRIMRFSSYPKAQLETYKLARSGFRSDRFVVEFLDPSITDDEWRWVVTIVDGAATPSPD
ncbi:hypothetical protein ACFRFH_11780 [Leifsonia sp. NPDC056824]|uniref:hypothetical protein n=1 Tax=Leifsonia sp. NPDC056824 TaxID=3345953 RepID=UPI00367A2C9D